MPPVSYLEAGASLHKLDSNWTIHYVTLRPAADGTTDIAGRHWIRWIKWKKGWLTSDEFLLTREEARSQLSIAADRLFSVLPQPSPQRPLFSVFSGRQIKEVAFPADSAVFSESIWLFQTQDSKDLTYWNCWAWYQGIVVQQAADAGSRAISTETSHPSIISAVEARIH